MASGMNRAAVAVTFALALAACGGGSQTSSSSRSTTSTESQTSSTQTQASVPTTSTTQTTPPKPPPPPPPAYPRLLPAALTSGPTPFVPAVAWGNRPVAWVSRSPSGVALLSFDQRALQLRLHSGTIDAGTSGWKFGPSVLGAERGRLVAAFNGGFKLSVGAGGFTSYGRVAVPLRDGLGSIVTYADGRTDIGAWHQGVPGPGPAVVSVRQNLSLLVDHGTAASTVDCVSCWGATLGGVSDPARSALGINNLGQLVWAGGEHLTVSDLASALVGAHVMRAVELDINPEWVASYLYGHRGGHGPLAAVPVMPGQQGIPGQFLVPWSRDFFTIEAK
jgi:hypothetical protein